MRLLKYILLCCLALSANFINAAELEYEQKYQTIDQNNILLIRYEDGKPRLLSINNFKNDRFKLDDLSIVDDKNCRVYSKKNWICKDTDPFRYYVMFNGRLVSPDDFKLVDSK